MKSALITLLVLLFSLSQAVPVEAGETAEKRVQADVLYAGQDFKKAYRIYFKLAKTGDHHSQGRLAGMYAKGEGKPEDLSKAYAWAVLAEEGGAKGLAQGSAGLLELAEDRGAAKKAALKLQRKYDTEALREKAIKQAERDAARQSGASMGSNLSR